MYTFSPLLAHEPNHIGFFLASIVLGSIAFFGLKTTFGIIQSMRCQLATRSEGRMLLGVLFVIFIGLGYGGLLTHDYFYGVKPAPVNKEVLARFEQFVPLREIKPGMKTHQVTTETLYVQLRLESNDKSIILPFNSQKEMPQRVVLYWNPAS